MSYLKTKLIDRFAGCFECCSLILKIKRITAYVIIIIEPGEIVCRTRYLVVIAADQHIVKKMANKL